MSECSTTILISTSIQLLHSVLFCCTLLLQLHIVRTNIKFVSLKKTISMSLIKMLFGIGYWEWWSFPYNECMFSWTLFLDAVILFIILLWRNNCHILCCIAPWDIWGAMAYVSDWIAEVYCNHVSYGAEARLYGRMCWFQLLAWNISKGSWFPRSKKFLCLIVPKLSKVLQAGYRYFMILRRFD